ncbi:MAG TPA: acyl-CoA dehydrogenase family protein [Streptosporangiaceae bacterium]|jgi:acyl-CoA dehydrogenase
MTTANALTGPDPVLTETVAAILADHCAPQAVRDAEAGPGWAPALWDVLAEAGLTGVGVPEEFGGAGGTLADAAEIVRLTGYAAAPVPYADTVLVAAPALAAAGIRVPGGPVAAVPDPGALRAVRDGAAWTVTGRAAHVPYARTSAHLAAVADGPDGPVIVLLPAAGLDIVAGRDYAGEPRDTVTAAGVHVPAEAAAPYEVRGDAGWRAHGALARALQIAGALERALELTVAHATTRVQFGRPIAGFQAVQHLIAQLGEDVAAARMAAESAAAALAAGMPYPDVPTAKIVAGEAATRGSALAHQVHGAMGMTRECDLQLFTRRLWTWREEYGSETVWSRDLGDRVATHGGAGVWPLITTAI